MGSPGDDSFARKASRDDTGYTSGVWGSQQTWQDRQRGDKVAGQTDRWVTGRHWICVWGLGLSAENGARQTEGEKVARQTDG